MVVKKVEKISGALHLFGIDDVDFSIENVCVNHGIELSMFHSDKIRVGVKMEGDTEMEASEFIKKFKNCKVEVEQGVTIYPQHLNIY